LALNEILGVSKKFLFSSKEEQVYKDFFGALGSDVLSPQRRAESLKILAGRLGALWIVARDAIFLKALQQWLEAHKHEVGDKSGATATSSQSWGVVTQVTRPGAKLLEYAETLSFVGNISIPTSCKVEAYKFMQTKFGKDYKAKFRELLDLIQAAGMVSAGLLQSCGAFNGAS